MKNHIEKTIALCILVSLCVYNITLFADNKKEDREFPALVRIQEAVTAELETLKEDFKAKEEERNTLKLELEKNQKKISELDGNKSFIKDEEYLMIYGEWKIVERNFYPPYYGYIPKEEFLGKTFYIDHNKYIFDDTLICEGSPLIYPVTMIPKSYWNDFIGETVRSADEEKEKEVFGNTGEYHVCFSVPEKADVDRSIENMFVVDVDTLIVVNYGSGFYTAKRIKHVDNWQEKIKSQ